jgi:diaminopimelate epimerase
MKFVKYHALGNDYIVIDPALLDAELTETQIRLICHRNYGIGSDGILLGPLESATCDFGLRIFNPDGSEAEKSGNGLRIFSRYLWDQKRVREAPFTVNTLGGQVRSCVSQGGKVVEVEMGRITFCSSEIPVAGTDREVINEKIQVAGQEFIFCAASIGNPHCVILQDEISAEDAKKYGPYIENHPMFPNRINVQFVKVKDRHNIRVEIWERGAGYTLASGSSSSAAAAVCRRLGHCDSPIAVDMPGGRLDISLSDDYDVTMRGPVTKIGEGTLSPELFERNLNG